LGEVDTFDGAASTACGDVLLVLWTTPLRLEHVRWVGRHLDGMAARYAGGFAMAQFISPTSSPPRPPGNAEAMDTIRRHGSALRLLVTVPLANGFWGSVVRSYMRATMIVTGRHGSFPIVATEARAVERLRAGATRFTPGAQHIEVSIGALHDALHTAWSSRAGRGRGAVRTWLA